MLYLVTFIMILLEVSLPFTTDMYLVTLPFIAYLVNLNREKGVGIVVLIALFHSLQTDEFLEIGLILIGTYYLLCYIFTHLTYSKANIVIISFLQGGVYLALTLNNFNRDYFIINMCSFVILNYIYMRISKKKDSIKG